MYIKLKNWCSFEDQNEIWLDRISIWLNDKCCQVHNNELTQVSNNENQLLDNATLADLFIEQSIHLQLAKFHNLVLFLLINLIIYFTNSRRMWIAKLRRVFPFQVYRYDSGTGYQLG